MLLVGNPPSWDWEGRSSQSHPPFFNYRMQVLETANRVAKEFIAELQKGGVTLPVRAEDEDGHFWISPARIVFIPKNASWSGEYIVGQHFPCSLRFLKLHKEGTLIQRIVMAEKMAKEEEEKYIEELRKRLDEIVDILFLKD